MVRARIEEYTSKSEEFDAVRWYYTKRRKVISITITGSTVEELESASNLLTDCVDMLGCPAIDIEGKYHTYYDEVDLSRYYDIDEVYEAYKSFKTKLASINI